MIAIGALRKRILIEQDTGTTQDARGAPVESWTPVATVWASIEPLNGREGLVAQQIYATATHRIVIRYLAGIRPKMRAALNGRLFDIAAVLNINERNREMHLLAVERGL